MFCTLAVILTINGQTVQQPTLWIGGERTKAEGGLTADNCGQFVTKYNDTHENQLVCVCGK